jgi:hypothetical protein
MRQETLEVNGFKIVLPIGLEETMNTKVRDSYQTFLRNSTNDVRRHLTCLTTLLPPEIKHMIKPKVLHAFGGLGASAQVIDQTVDGAYHEFWERDPTCVAYLMKSHSNVQKVEDSMPRLAEWNLAHFDVILLDMSVGTIKTPGVKEMWQNVAAAVKQKPEIVVWFTDTACHKMHLNWRSYIKDFCEEAPIKGPTVEAYMDAYSSWLSMEHQLLISSAMREAGEVYAVVKHVWQGQPFKTIPYI